tara:strand:+ start:1126 stop:1317 length:192 start_codon:yes stop_codon:yes gene_type:complete
MNILEQLLTDTLDKLHTEDVDKEIKKCEAKILEIKDYAWTSKGATVEIAELEARIEKLKQPLI